MKDHIYIVETRCCNISIGEGFPNSVEIFISEDNDGFIGSIAWYFAPVVEKSFKEYWENILEEIKYEHEELLYGENLYDTFIPKIKKTLKNETKKYYK